MVAAIIHPIRNDADLKAALRRLDHLMDSKELADAEADEMEVLCVLVHDYETRVEIIDEAPPCQVIRHVMDAQGLGPEDLMSVIGSKERVLEILAGTRRPTLAMIRRLSDRFHIPAGALI
jgi:HTH-type transcriptional regulator / antitoxin HigA